MSAFPEKLDGAKVLTPASNDLYKKRGAGKLMSVEEGEMFHNIVEKFLYVSNRARPDISPTVNILCGRVRDANRNDWKKLRRLVKYLICTKDLHIMFWYDGLSLAR